MSTPCANVTTSVVLSLARADALARRHERELSAPLRSRFVELLLALGGNGTVNVIVIGGSIPAARMCVRTGASGLWASKYVCSYPSRFARWLAAAHCRDRSAVNFVNRASGGSTTAGWLPSLPSVPLQNERPDGLLLIDFAMNDKFDGVDFSRNESNQVVSTSPVAAATEVMLRFLLGGPHSAQPGSCRGHLRRRQRPLSERACDDRSQVRRTICALPCTARDSICPPLRQALLPCSNAGHYSLAVQGPKLRPPRTWYVRADQRWAGALVVGFREGSLAIG